MLVLESMFPQEAPLRPAASVATLLHSLGPGAGSRVLMNPRTYTRVLGLIRSGDRTLGSQVADRARYFRRCRYKEGSCLAFPTNPAPLSWIRFHPLPVLMFLSSLGD